MRSSERHQLKENQFATATQETLSWAVGHRNPLLYVSAVAIVVLALLAGGFYYQQSREQKAALMFGQALELYTAPLRPAGAPEAPGQTTFTTPEDRAKAASNKFIEVSDKYGRTDSGVMAKYFLGLTAEDLKDNTKAEQYLKDVADSSNKDIAALAKSALGALYHDTGRDPLAIETYKSLVEKPTNTVPKASSQLALAEIYAMKDKAQARVLYEQIGKENSDNAIGNIANARMAELK